MTCDAVYNNNNDSNYSIHGQYFFMKKIDEFDSKSVKTKVWLCLCNRNLIVINWLSQQWQQRHTMTQFIT